jgi:hypothetical protein
MTPRSFVAALAATLALYGFLGWAYIAMNAVFHPESLSWPLTHFLSYPREDTFGIASFLVSGTAFFVWRIMRE